MTHRCYSSMKRLGRSFVGRRFVTAAVLLTSILQAVNVFAAPVYRKGVTLAGDPTVFTQNNFSELQRILNTGVGVIGLNLPWFAATQDCSTCSAQRPSNARAWNDPVYAGSAAVQTLDQISNYVANHGSGAFMMVITYGTPGWAACPGDPTDPAKQPYYPPQNAADYGDFMYAMSERYNGTHTSNQGIAMGFVRDWVVYNEVNSPSWWHNTACNTAQASPVYYYGGIMNQAYTSVHHLPVSSGVRVLAGAFTSYDRVDYTGTPGLRISTSYADWKANTDNNNANSAWISPLDFVTDIHTLGIQFDAIALHPYPPKIYDNPLLQPPTGGVSLGNISALLSLQQSLWPTDNTKWHLCLTEYFQHSYYGNTTLGWDHVSAVPCPNYFCAQTTEVNLNSFVQTAYGTGGSHQSYVDYLMWGIWQNVNPYVGGLVRADLSDKNENLGSGSIRATFTAVQP